MRFAAHGVELFPGPGSAVQDVAQRSEHTESDRYEGQYVRVVRVWNTSFVLSGQTLLKSSALVVQQAAFDPIAPAYANALVDLALEKKLLNEIHSDVDTLRVGPLRSSLCGCKHSRVASADVMILY